MSRAEKDLICRDLAGVDRFVRFGSDIPEGWKVVREAEGSLVPADAEAPRTIGNVDAAAERARRLAGDAERQADREAGARARLEPAEDLDRLEVDELERRARDLGIYDQIEGTGKNGNVVKGDLVDALKAQGPH